VTLNLVDVYLHFSDRRRTTVFLVLAFLNISGRALSQDAARTDNTRPHSRHSAESFSNHGNG